VSSFGVCYNKWSRLRTHVGANKFYKKIVYRSIDTIRDDPMFDKVEQFLKEVVGHNYGLRPKDVLRSETVSN
jgi:hypothetical protein